MANRLSDQSSPYLLQHKDNPVEWWPWCEEALASARAEDRPILISIGYSACHWCHVMERESFEDPETADMMNRGFVCIKVDREERPDVDAIYMEAVQAMTGQGGWPLTVFCDPEGVPFHGGTYFPPRPRQGMPSFGQVLTAVTEAFHERRDEIQASAPEIRRRLGITAEISDTGEGLPAGIPEQAEVALLESADREHGGFGGAPKFPPASVLEFLLSRGETEVSALTLDAMQSGGIYDQLGGGFARYSVDSRWLVPHFEKMLYDNALLARSYLAGWKAIGKDAWRRAVEETLDWALNEMRGEEGGFYSALDADSEGQEGAFYVWTETELRETLAAGGVTDDACERILGYWGVSASGNFEGRNILHVAAGSASSPPEELPTARALLMERRNQRERPGLDDKRICSWNALMLSAFAQAGAAFLEERFLAAAVDCADFLLEQMRTPEGRLLRTWKDGTGSLNGYLEDYAFTVEALLDLFAATLEPRWLTEAQTLADQMIENFEDVERGGFFTTSHDHEELLVRRKDIDDHPIPSATSSAAMGLLRLGLLTGKDSYSRSAQRAISPLAEIALKSPGGFGHLLQAIDLATASNPRQLAIVYPRGSSSQSFPGGEIAETAAKTLLPHTVVGGGPEGTQDVALLIDKRCSDASPTAFLCEQFACKEPVVQPDDLLRQLNTS